MLEKMLRNLIAALSSEFCFIWEIEKRYVICLQCFLQILRFMQLKYQKCYMELRWCF